MVSQFNRTCIAAVLGWAMTLGFALSAQAAGLLAPTDRSLPPLRITEHVVDAKIHDQIALTTIRQTFRNDTSRRLEATYIFPLPENAELTNFEMSFNGKMVEGEVLPADKARQIYESIVRQTKDPGLIEFIGQRLLQMRVFPIEPGSDTKIQVKYQQVCKPVSGMSAYHYPLRTAKTASSAGGGGEAHGTVRFGATLHTSSPLKNIWSPTHSVEIVRDGEHEAKIAYEASKGSLEEDFLLLYDTDASDLGLSVIAYQPGSGEGPKPGHFVLTLTPKQLWPQQDQQPQDVVFVIDTSGSMAGEKLQQAKSALKYCVDQLNDRDRFGIVRFSTGFDVLSDELQSATQENRAEARKWIDKFKAAGGTNITDALMQALDMRPGRRAAVKKVDEQEEDEDWENDGEREAASRDDADGRPFVIVFITDGQGNQPADETMERVKKHRASDGARIFPFGVGHDVNTLLLDQLATSYVGRPTYVQPGENLELVLGDFFSVISQPVLTDLRLSLPDINATEKFPATLGDLYHGQQLIVAGKFEKPRTGRVKLTATRNGETVEYVWEDVAFEHTEDAQYVPAIWAGRKISYLIDQIRAHGESQEMIDEIIALSQEYGIQTPYTSWLVTPENEQWVRGRRHRAFPWASTPTGGGPAASPASQLGALRAAGVPVSPATAGGDRDGADAMSYEYGPVDAVAGEAATELARRNAQLRESRAIDAQKLDHSILPTRKIAGRWYNRIDRFLVDERVDEKTSLIVVRFGSNAYFEVLRCRPELRPAFATSPNIVVMLTDTHGIVVSDRTGIDEISDEQMEHLGLGVR